MQRIAVYGVVLFLIFAINKDPENAGDQANDFLGVVGDALDSGLQFVDGLVSPNA